MRNFAIAIFFAVILAFLMGTVQGPLQVNAVFAQSVDEGPKSDSIKKDPDVKLDKKSTSTPRTLGDPGPTSVGDGDSATGSWDIYVRNKQLVAPYQMYKGMVYVPIVPFIKALRFSCSQGDDKVVHISSKPGDTPEIQGGGTTINCEYNGSTFGLPVMAMKGFIFVQLRGITRNLGVSYVRSPATGIIDVVVPQGMSASQFEKEKNIAVNRGSEALSTGRTSTDTKLQGDAGPTASGTEKKLDTSGPTSTSQGPGQTTVGEVPPKKDDKKEEESPIKQIGEVGGFADTITGQCYWDVTVKNSGDQVVKNVVVTLHIQDVEGKDITSQIKPIGSMNPGDQSKLDFYWQGGRKMIYAPKVEIKHDPLPKKEEPKKDQPTPAPKK
jgi:hypothetical protein